jgi:hypothetical protein
MTVSNRTVAFQSNPTSKEHFHDSLRVYHDSFPNAHLIRSKTGVLEVALHTNGRTIPTSSSSIYLTQSAPILTMVILTGSAEAFMESITPDGFDFFSPQGYDKIYREGKRSS